MSASCEGRGPGRPRGSVSPDELKLLALLRDAAPGPKRKTVVSTAAMVEELGFSSSKVKMLRKSMQERELIDVSTRSAANGASLENAYRITRKGRRMLFAYEEALGVDICAGSSSQERR